MAKVELLMTLVSTFWLEWFSHHFLANLTYSTSYEILQSELLKGLTYPSVDSEINPESIWQLWNWGQKSNFDSRQERPTLHRLLRGVLILLIIWAHCPLLLLLRVCHKLDQACLSDFKRQDVYVSCQQLRSSLLGLLLSWWMFRSRNWHFYFPISLL